MKHNLFGHHHRAADHHHFAGVEGQLLVAVGIAVVRMGGKVVVIDKLEKRDFALAADPVFAEMRHQHRKLEHLLQGRLR